MPVRLGAEYVSEDGSKKHPVMLHRAICGSLERFIGILIEHHAGKFPLWLAPVQVSILNISEKQAKYAMEVQKHLHDMGYRCKIDTSNEKIGYKIRHWTLQKVPFLLIIGDNEMANQSVTIRRLDGVDLGVFKVTDVHKTFIGEVP